MSENDNNRYPKALSGRQCIGHCYEPNVRIIHPTTLETFSLNYPACPITPYQKREGNIKKTIVADKCGNPTHDAQETDKMQINLLTQQVYFDMEQFVKIYYDIFSLEECLDWIDKNKNLPTQTKMRVMRCALYSYGKDIDIVDHRFINFILFLIKTKYIKNMYDILHKYITIKDEVVQIIKSQSNKLKYDEYIVERTNYILQAFVGTDDIYKFISRYLRNNKAEWDMINDHLIDIINEFMRGVENRVKLYVL
jgi:hypothetical protein